MRESEAKTEDENQLYSGAFNSKHHLHKFEINIIFLFEIYEFFWSKPPKIIYRITHRRNSCVQIHRIDFVERKIKKREKSSLSFMLLFF